MDVRNSATGAPSQDKTDAADSIHCGAIWKAPRCKRQCIQGSIKSVNGGPQFFDLRIFEADARGRMRATGKGITVSMARLPQLAQLVGTAVRNAHAANLIEVSS